PIIKPTKIAPNVNCSKSLKAKDVTQNMSKYMAHIKNVWNIKAHLFFILKILSIPSTKPPTNLLIFKAILELLLFKYKKPTIANNPPKDSTTIIFVGFNLSDKNP